MSWLYEKWSLTSERNGQIDCQRLLGEWTVSVQKTHESSSYMRHMWKEAVYHLAPYTPVKRILMLGMAAGASVELLHRRFPGCHITAIEWDPIMVEVMDRLKLFKPAHRPEILLGDAAEVIPTLHKQFDLILFDLYRGPTTPEQVKDEKFFRALQPCLAPGGFLIVNSYAQKEIQPTVSKSFAFQTSWKYALNHLSLFRPFGAGTVGDPLPSSYVPFRSSPIYVRRELGSDPAVKLIENSGMLGFRRWSGPLCVEKYYGDAEPTIDPTGPKRLVIWQRIQKTDRPAGWRESLVAMNARVTGFVDLRASSDPFDRWTPHAKRHLKKWLTQTSSWDVVDLTLEEFLKAYNASPLSRTLKDMHQTILLRKSKAHGDLLHLRGLKRRANGKIEAGFASLDVPEIHQSIHIASFINDTAKDDPVGTGLVYLWFKDAPQRDIQFLDFDLFYAPGDPKAWKGFSKFKAQFGTYMIKYPKPLLRWTGSWKEYFAERVPSKSK
jgi:spermidine synthase